MLQLPSNFQLLRDIQHTALLQTSKYFLYYVITTVGMLYFVFSLLCDNNRRYVIFCIPPNVSRQICLQFRFLPSVPYRRRMWQYIDKHEKLVCTTSVIYDGYRGAVMMESGIVTVRTLSYQYHRFVLSFRTALSAVEIIHMLHPFKLWRYWEIELVTTLVDTLVAVWVWLPSPALPIFAVNRWGSWYRK